jgi:hypothetical protein
MEKEYMQYNAPKGGGSTRCYFVLFPVTGDPGGNELKVLRLLTQLLEKAIPRPANNSVDPFGQLSHNSLALSRTGASAPTS